METVNSLALRKHLAGAKIALCVAMKNLHEGKTIASYSSINLAMLEMTRAQRILRKNSDGQIREKRGKKRMTKRGIAEIQKKQAAMKKVRKWGMICGIGLMLGAEAEKEMARQ